MSRVAAANESVTARNLSKLERPSRTSFAAARQSSGDQRQARSMIACAAAAKAWTSGAWRRASSGRTVPLRAATSSHASILAPGAA